MAAVRHSRRIPVPRANVLMPWLLAMLYCGAAAAALWATGPGFTLTRQIALWLPLFTAFQVLLMLLSVPTTAFGNAAITYSSFDRFPIVAALLVFGPRPAAWMAGTAVLVWTLAADPRNPSPVARLRRGMACAGMFVLAILGAGTVYRALGGTVPLRHLTLTDLGRTAAMIVVLQAINEVLISGLDWRSLQRAAHRSWVYVRGVLIEAAIGLTGVVGAVIFTRLPLEGFLIYAAFIVSVAVLFRRVVHIAQRERRHAEEAGAVNRINQAVSATANLDEIIETIFNEVRGLIDFDVFLLSIYDEQANELDIRLHHDDGTRHPPARRRPGEGLLAWTIEHQEPVLIGNVRRDNHPAVHRMIVVGRIPASLLAVPINFEDRTVGVISVQAYDTDVFNNQALHLLQNFAAQIAVAVVNTRLFADLRKERQTLKEKVASRTAALRAAVQEKDVLLHRLERENRRDPLTGIGNRRSLDEVLRRELHRAERFGHPFSIAICDLDHFKSVNDTLGHSVGDDVLKAVANVLRDRIRTTDFVARYGGEEFVLVFPETQYDGALAVCEQLRTLIQQDSWQPESCDLKITMSVGVAALDQATRTPERLLASADAALYRAKWSGRNCVCGFGDGTGA